MELGKFINKFVAPNSLVRLWYPCQGGHEQVEDSSLKMEWEWLGTPYKDKQVKYVVDILVLEGNYKEAINIVLEKD